MKLIKFSYHLFCKNILMSIIIIIQLVTSTLLLSDILVTANSYFVTVDEYISSGLSNINGILGDYGGYPVPDRLLNKLPENSIDYCELGGVAYCGEYSLYGYSDEFVNDYTPELLEGTWLNECTDDLKNIPVVIPYSLNKHFNIGDIIDIDSENGFTGKIVGILKTSYYCTFNNGGTELNTKDMLGKADESFEIPLLTLYNYLPKEIISTGMTEAIVLKNSNDLNEAYKLFSNYYYVRTFFDVLENGKEDAYARVRALGPILLTLSLVSLFGMIGCIAISTYKNLYFYSILYLCGASTKKCFLISLLYTVIYIVLTLVVFFVIFIFVMQKSMCWLNYIAIIAIIMILLSLSLIPYRILKKNPPIEVFKYKR